MDLSTVAVVFVLEQVGPPQRHVTAGKEEGDTAPLGFFSGSAGLPHTVWQQELALEGRDDSQTAVFCLLPLSHRAFVNLCLIHFSPFCLPITGQMCPSTVALASWGVLFVLGKLPLSSSKVYFQTQCTSVKPLGHSVSLLSGFLVF